MAAAMKFLNHLEEWFITFLMAGATLIIFVAVVHRYAAGWPIPVVQDWLLGLNFGWAQELCIIMFVWMAKFGAAYGVRTGIHVGVDVLINKMKKPLRGKFIIFGLLAGATFTSIVAYFGFNFIWENGMHYAVYSKLGIASPDMFAGPTTPRSRVADLGGLQRRPLRFLPDVFPLSPGHLQLHPLRRAAET